MAGPSISKSEAADNRMAGTDQARVFRGVKGQYTESGAVSFGKDANIQAAGSIRGNIGNNANVTINDPAAALAALDAITKVNAQSLEAQQAATAQSGAALQSALGLVSQFTSDAQENSSAVNWRKWALWGGLAALAALFLFKRK